MSLLKHLKCHFLEYHSAVNVLTGPKAAKSARHHFYRIVLSILNILSWKKLLLVRYETSRLFVNTLPADEKCSRQNSENFSQSFEMQLPQNVKNVFLFFFFFFEFLKSTLNVEYFETKKMSLIA